jgi:hypothetical protein
MTAVASFGTVSRVTARASVRLLPRFGMGLGKKPPDGRLDIRSRFGGFESLARLVRRESHVNQLRNGSIDVGRRHGGYILVASAV